MSEFVKQNIEQEAAVVRQMDNFAVRYYFAPYLDASINEMELPAGTIHLIDRRKKIYRPDELPDTIQRNQVEIIPYGKDGQASELWALPVLPGEMMTGLLADNQRNAAGGGEIEALRGFRFDVSVLNRWLFSAGSDSLNNLRTSQAKADSNLYQEVGLPTGDKDAVRVFKAAAAQVAVAIDRAETWARGEYQRLVLEYETARAGNQPINWHGSSYYRKLVTWLDEVDVVEAATAKVQRANNSNQEAAMAAFGNVLADKLGQVLAPLANLAATAVAPATVAPNGKPAKAQPAA